LIAVEIATRSWAALTMTAFRILDLIVRARVRLKRTDRSSAVAEMVPSLSDTFI
jgi:hypothetical protein